MAASTQQPIQRDSLLRKRLDRFTRLLPALAEGDVNALHRTRVASRRLRELLPILQLNQEEAQRISRRLRKITRRLGDVRELDVLLILIDELHESRRHDHAALSRVANEVGLQRTRAREKLLGRRLPIDELNRIARRLGRAADELTKSDDNSAGPSRLRGWRWALDARIARRAASLRDTIADAGAVYLPDRIHGVRISVKKLRYALEIAADAAGTRTTPDLRELKRAQNLLGRLHDLQVLTERVRGVQASLAPPNIAAWRELDALTTALENSCRRLHARYVHDRIGLDALCDRLLARTPKRAARKAV
jgi:CHAD domain-containing protein